MDFLLHKIIIYTRDKPIGYGQKQNTLYIIVRRTIIIYNNYLYRVKRTIHIYLVYYNIINYRKQIKTLFDIL